jgi:hypothetical protein
MVAEAPPQVLTAEEREERDRMVRKTRALVQIEMALEQEAAAAAHTKAEEERAAARQVRRALRPPPTINRILGGS